MSGEEKPKRRVRYAGTHPRRFSEKYKELNPEKYPETVAKVIASGKTPAGAHRPIMVEEILRVLDLKPGAVGVDCTLGYGGHATEILRAITPAGKLIGIDTDPIEIEKTTARLRAIGFGEDVFVAKHTNFAALPKVLGEAGVEAVDFILADLGVSSMQLDDPTRGFSFKVDAPLDLRMNPAKGVPAAELLRGLNEEKLREVLVLNADEPFAREIATGLAGRRIETTRQLADAVKDSLRVLPRRERDAEGDKPIRRVFQALRILVNDEFRVLEQLLRVIPASLKPGGRVAILTFHSGEDRRVKHAFQEWHRARLFSAIAGDPLRPTAHEVNQNPRASSAKLRWGVKNESTG